MKKIDPNSEEFKAELEKTVKFTDKVVKNFGFEYNFDDEINQSIQMGLTRNKLMYGKRFCPCFFVTGNKEEDRICPCKPAIDYEIKDDGHCHCGIFCSQEYVQKQKMESKVEEVTHNHSRGLNQEECELLLAKEQLDGDEVEALVEAKALGMVDFNLVDVREFMEWFSGRIEGVDYLIPASSFYAELEKIEDKAKPVIVYCHIGSRSSYCQKVMKDLGFKQVSNLTHGIVSYNGNIVSGE